MSLNKKALLRYMVYDRCFRDEAREYTISDLLEECNQAFSGTNTKGVCRRQLYYDIEFMKSPEGFQAPICSKKNNKGNSFFYYKDKSYSIFSFLTGEECMGTSEFVYLLKIIGMLTGKEFIDMLVHERGYRNGVLLKSIQHLTQIKGILSQYQDLKKLYVVIESILLKKTLHIQRHNQLYLLQPEMIQFENNAFNICFAEKNNMNLKRTFPLNDLNILKNI